MSNKQFFNNLSATYADVRKLDVKKINLKGKDILEYINEATPTIAIKHSQDTRETVTENDLWGQWVETTSDGTIIVHDDWVTNPTLNGAWKISITKVEDKKAYVGDTLYGNIQTERIKDAKSFFYMDTSLTAFSGDLNNVEVAGGTGVSDGMFAGCTNLASCYVRLANLKHGGGMFMNCTSLTDLNNYGNSSSFYESLSNLLDGYRMFQKCTNLVGLTFMLPNLTNGLGMFLYCSKIKTCDTDLHSLTNGSYMFNRCSNLETFHSELPSLTNGSYMFDGCTNLKSFSSNLSSLTDGSYMFGSCSNLKLFTSKLPRLTNGISMFYLCDALTEFSSDLPSLMKGHGMFNSCPKLESVTSDLSSLTIATYMFQSCTQLKSFTSNLSSLISGIYMFDGCKLDAESVMFIADTIRDITAEKQLYTSGSIPYIKFLNGAHTSPRGFMSNGDYVYTYNNPKPYTETIPPSYVGLLTLGINVTNNSSTIQQQLEDFAKAATFDTWSDLKKHFSDKGWTVTFQYAGSSTSITYDLRDGEQIIPCQIFAKLIEIEPQGIEYDEDGNVIRENFYTDEQIIRASYCNVDASTFYNIEWGHDVTDTTDYTQFDSLEDAMTSWNVFPKENIISTEE